MACGNKNIVRRLAPVIFPCGRGAGRDDGRRLPASAASRGGAPPSFIIRIKRASIFLIEFACDALTVMGLIALLLYGFIRSVLLKPLAIAGLAARSFSCGGFLKPHQC